MVIEIVIPASQLPHLRAALDRYARAYPTESDFCPAAWARVMEQVAQQHNGDKT
jgi:hypothetical protein